jgi:hypothetical protein
MIKTFLVAADQTVNFKLPSRPCYLALKSPMSIRNISAALMAAGLLLAAPAFAETAPAEKQKTQEGAPSMPGPAGGPANADPNYKQKAQEGTPSMPGPAGGPANADPNYKQQTQEGVPSMPGPVGGPANADPNYKQRAQNETPSANETGTGSSK